jgi:hypothetical protein
MEDRETARMRKYGESKTTRIMMATEPHVTSGLGLRKFQADGFLLTRVYCHQIIQHIYELLFLRVNWIRVVALRPSRFTSVKGPFGRCCSYGWMGTRSVVDALELALAALQLVV